jgi:methionyl-tRNA synthetase
MNEALGITATPNLTEQGKCGITKPGTRIQPGAALFPRLDKQKKGDQPQAQKTKAKEQKKQKKNKDGADDGLITFDAFQKLDLRVAEIVAAEKIAKSDRLLKLTVKAPEERTIVAGIAEHYQPDEVIGRLVIIVANLKPVKLMGVKSHGMVMAAKEGDKLVLSTVSDGVQPGSKVS